MNTTTMTNDTKHTHTPGPWDVITHQIHGTNECEFVIVPRDDDRGDVCRVVPGAGVRRDVANERADALLIAAAPELLEALKEAVRELLAVLPADFASMKSEKVIKRARAAILRAEGQ